MVITIIRKEIEFVQYMTILLLIESRELKLKLQRNDLISAIYRRVILSGAYLPLEMLQI